MKEELDRMLEGGIIEHVEELEWISPIVIQDKKETGEVSICVDLRKLNYSCIHDPCPTQFIDEVMESIGRKEMYSFTDGFSSYQQVIIVQEDCHKTTL